MAFRDDFDGPELDTSVLAAALPARLELARSDQGVLPADDSCLVLDVPVDHPVWARATTTAAARARPCSRAAGPGRSAASHGQQRFREGQLVREEQPRFEGWLPSSGPRRDPLPDDPLAAVDGGAVAGRVRGRPRAAAVRELCVVEIFGQSVEVGSCEVGMGIKAFRDPALTQDFDAPRLPIDVADFHTYAVDWDADEAVFTVDGEEVRRCPRPPTYPLQLMVAVYDFPEWSVGGDDHLVPELVVDHIAGVRAQRGQPVARARRAARRSARAPARRRRRARSGARRSSRACAPSRRRFGSATTAATASPRASGSRGRRAGRYRGARPRRARRRPAARRPARRTPRPRARACAHVVRGAGLHEQVERGDGRCRLTRLELAGEPHRVRQPAAQPGLLGAVADDDEPGAGHAGDLGETAYAVPLAEAADVADDDLREVAVGPGGAQRRVAAARVEDVGVDAGRPAAAPAGRRRRAGPAATRR